MRHLPLRAPRLALAALLALAACRPDGATDPVARPVAVTIAAVLTDAQQQLIAGMSIEVTGPGITTPIVGQLDVAGATVNGTVNVPAGGNRRFTVHAYDHEAVETYTGTATVNVRPGSNPVVTITLYARTAGQPVVVTVGTLALALDPASVTFAVGATTTVTATITDADAPYSGDVVRWGALDPTLLRLTPDATGRTVQLAALRAGSTTLVASVGGIAAALPVTVDPPATGTDRFLANIMAVGPAHTCALALRRGPLADGIGRVLCWGDNALGQVGAPDPGPHLTPALVAEIDEAAGSGLTLVLAVGDAHSCALPLRNAPSEDPTAAGCWGDAAAFGGDPAVHGVQRFVLPAGERTWHLAAGAHHTCVASVAGTVYCAGDPADGRLGGTPASPRALVAVPPQGGAPFYAVAAGERHTCALDNSGEVWCWGDNSRGELGDGSTTSSATPVLVAGGHEFHTLWAGDDVTCASAVDLVLYCWGDNSRGQLRRTPEATATEGPLPYATTPRAVYTATGSVQLLDEEVPLLGLSDFSVTAWGFANGVFTESQPFPGAQFVYAASYRQRFCGLPFVAVLHCTGSYPGDGSAAATGLVSVDLGAAIRAAGGAGAAAQVIVKATAGRGTPR